MLKLARCGRARFASVQATDSVTTTGTGVRPYEEIPEAKMSLTSTATLLFNLMRGKPPAMMTVVKNTQEKYGNIFKMTAGPFPATTVLRPEDVEVVFRNDGKVPIRDAMPIWNDAMKSLGKDLTLFHRLVSCAGRTLARGSKSCAIHCRKCTLASPMKGVLLALQISQGPPSWVSCRLAHGAPLLPPLVHVFLL